MLSSEELNELFYYQNSIFFQLQGDFTPPNSLTKGSASGPRWGLCSQTPVIGSRFALAMSSPHCLEEIAATVRESGSCRARGLGLT